MSTQVGLSLMDHYDNELPNAWLQQFTDYLYDHHIADLKGIMEEWDNSAHYGIEVDVLDLLDVNMALGSHLLSFPQDLLPIFDEALVKVQGKIEDSKESYTATVKTKVHVRLHSFPHCPEISKTSLPRSRDIGHIISVTGTVIRTGMVKMLEYKRQYQCAVCKFPFEIVADIEQYNAIPKPMVCPSSKSGTSNPCRSTKFEALEGKTGCRDYQEIKIQEHVQKLKVGNIPRSMAVILMDDLVDKVKAGDEVTVCGTVLRRWRPLKDKERCDMEITISANSVSVHNEENISTRVTDELRTEFEEFWAQYRDRPIEGRNMILRNICPQIYGMHTVKLGVILVLLGGVPRRAKGGMAIRGEIHMLLVGDPGTGKSQFLKYAHKLSNRAVHTTGVGTTTAGLTVTAVKDTGGEWMLEAGALVLADGGLCCIDEFDKMREHDRTAIHEAMEQQTLSVAKAGLVCKLNTRCSILASGNPRGKYDPTQSISVNIAMASPLLSRFDIVLTLVDTQNGDWDKVVSDFILREHQQGGHSQSSGGESPNDRAEKARARRRRRETQKDDMDEEEEGGVALEDLQAKGGLWGIDKVKAYIALARALEPDMSPESELVLSTYYKRQRQADGRNAARTTIRLLESLVRLAEAHARLMFHQRVQLDDALAAIAVVEGSMHASALISAPPALHSLFPQDGDLDFRRQKVQMLQRLNLSDLLTDDEKDAALLDLATPPQGTVAAASSSTLVRSSAALRRMQEQAAGAEQTTSGIENEHLRQDEQEESANNAFSMRGTPIIPDAPGSFAGF